MPSHIGTAIHAYGGESTVQQQIAHRNGGPPHTNGVLAMTGMDVLLLVAGAALILSLGIAIAWWQNRHG